MMGEVRAGIYPQASSHLLSKLAPQDDNSPVLLGHVTHSFGDPGGIRSHAFQCVAFLWVQKWRGGSREFLALYHLWSLMMCYRELHAALTLFVGPGPWRRSRAAELQVS